MIIKMGTASSMVRLIDSIDLLGHYQDVSSLLYIMSDSNLDFIQYTSLHTIDDCRFHFPMSLFSFGLLRDKWIYDILYVDKMAMHFIKLI